jgi:hypothetical protein
VGHAYFAAAFGQGNGKSGTAVNRLVGAAFVLEREFKMVIFRFAALKERCPVAIENAAQVTLRAILYVAVAYRVADRVILAGCQPAENFGGLARVGDAAVGGIAVMRCRAIAAINAPMGNLTLWANVAPALNAGERAFRAGAVAADTVRKIAFINDAGKVFYRNEVFKTR